MNKRDDYLAGFMVSGKGRRSRRKWVAVFVACLLLMQGAVAGMAFAAPAGTNASDAGFAVDRAASKTLKKAPLASPSAEATSDPTLKWIQNYGGEREDWLIDITPATGGGYIAVGHSGSSDGDMTGNRGSYDFVIAKFDDSGHKVWMKNFGGRSHDYLSGVTPASGGGYIAAGYSYSSDGDLAENKGEADFSIIKFNENGDIIWTRSYGGSAFDSLADIKATSDGGYLVAGDAYSSDGDLPGNRGFGADCTLMKIDANGEKIWLRTFGGSRDDRLWEIATTPDGGYVVVGESDSGDGDLSERTPGSNGSVMFIAKFDAGGNKIWLKSFNGDSNWNVFRAVTVARGGGYIAVGCTDSKTGEIPAVKGTRDIVIARFDEAGNKIWHKNYGGSSEQNLLYVRQAPNGGYIAAGCSMSGDGDLARNFGGRDSVLAKFDENGNKLWMKSYGGSGEDEFIAVVPGPDQRYVAVGYTASSDGDLFENKGITDFLVAQVTDPVLTGIAIATPPAVTTYTEGETLNLSGLSVKAVYDDGGEAPVTDYTATPAAGAALTTANTKVTITWQGKTAEIPIVVNRAQQVEPKLTVSATEGGSIIRLPLFNLGLKAGSKVTVYAFPNAGYKLARWETTGLYYAVRAGDPPAQAQSPLEFNMPAGEVTVKAVFEKLNLCTITASSEGLGLLLGAPATAYEGATVTMLAVPLWPFSRLDRWEINGVSAGNSLILNHQVTGDVTIKAVFK